MGGSSRRRVAGGGSGTIFFMVDLLYRVMAYLSSRLTDLGGSRARGETRGTGNPARPKPAHARPP